MTPGRTFWIPSTISWSPAPRPEDTSPFVADGSIDSDHPLLYLALSINDQCDGIALGITGDPLLWSENGIIHHSFLDKGAYIHARQEHVFRVRKDHPLRINDPVLGSTVTSENFSVPSNGIGCAVFKKQLHPCLVGAVAFDPTCCYVTFEVQQIGA